MARVAILAGCVAPGRDGVGDHSRRLAEELVRVGHEVLLIGLTGNEPSDVVAGPLRIRAFPYALDDSPGAREVRGLLADFGPDLVSVQFVPWSHGPRGTGRRLERLLRTIDAPRWQIMLHELWLHDTPIRRQRLLGLLQRRAIRQLLRARPWDVVHTSIEHYRRLLASVGVEARILPLFGNIPVPGGAEPLPDPDGLLHFGTPPSPERWPAIADEIAQIAPDLPIRLVGGAEDARAAFAATLRAAGLDVHDLGRLDDRELAGELARARVGLVRISRRYAGKSGVLAAMLEHGLPVWAPGLVPPDPPKVHDRLTDALTAPRRPARSRLHAVAWQMMHDARVDTQGLQPPS
ncbi:hypothetical protein K8Z61_10415 [Nocardioides sp. TRM66260-LWL]|uniref:glycosyltransferase n=1 Tax=Nocardioides sp. TRM66260-LWL TaxID=2874478 RepID=UPI001CC7ABF8|nr:glycosyltransferase [Nocardioides sp. TRM66260-LWL]MBZ5734909.1 hypothetical protein [Nocardioides sp. TRM66260-LWL]